MHTQNRIEAIGYNLLVAWDICVQIDRNCKLSIGVILLGTYINILHGKKSV
ncbi:MAG: hypothetical protein JWN56_749 [Sphingobacteriales bacterium]|nr:hypothetical protein [Sphingobacteriales bacterium]